MEQQLLAAARATAPGEDTITFPTVRFGEVTVARSKIIDFPRGLVGMPDARRFVFLHLEEGAGPFFWLQNIDDPSLAFVVCEPQTFFPDYRVALTREEQTFLGIAAAEDGVVCVLLVVPEDPMDITANLRGPLVVSIDKGRGMQLLLAEVYPTRAHLFQRQGEGETPCSS